LKFPTLDGITIDPSGQSETPSLLIRRSRESASNDVIDTRECSSRPVWMPMIDSSDYVFHGIRENRTDDCHPKCWVAFCEGTAKPEGGVDRDNSICLRRRPSKEENLCTGRRAGDRHLCHRRNDACRLRRGWARLRRGIFHARRSEDRERILRSL
jgi:hypothetical protein